MNRESLIEGIINYEEGANIKGKGNTKKYPKAEEAEPRKEKNLKGALIPRLGFRPPWRRCGYSALDGVELGWVAPGLHLSPVTGQVEGMWAKRGRQGLMAQTDK